MSKGGKYIFGWLSLKDNGVRLTPSLMQTLDIKAEDKLLAIRSSDIAFTLGAKGALIQKALEYTGEIAVFLINIRPDKERKLQTIVQIGDV